MFHAMLWLGACDCFEWICVCARVWHVIIKKEEEEERTTHNRCNNRDGKRMRKRIKPNRFCNLWNHKGRDSTEKLRKTKTSKQCIKIHLANRENGWNNYIYYMVHYLLLLWMANGGWWIVDRILCFVNGLSPCTIILHGARERERAVLHYCSRC